MSLIGRILPIEAHLTEYRYNFRYISYQLSPLAIQGFGFFLRRQLLQRSDFCTTLTVPKFWPLTLLERMGNV